MVTPRIPRLTIIGERNLSTSEPFPSIEPPISTYAPRPSEKLQASPISSSPSVSGALRLSLDSQERKSIPLAQGLLDYFPDALAAVAMVSYDGSAKHNGDGTLYWTRSISNDHADCVARHLLDRGGFDGKHRHSAMLAWRALALLQEEIEQAEGKPISRGSRS